VYRKQVRRRRAVLTLLVLGSFALLTATYSQGSGGLSGGVSTIFSPFESVADRALKPARDFLNWFDETFDARGENSRLREQLATARAHAVAGQVARQENAQLRDLVGLRRSGAIPAGYKPVAARVIARSPTVWYASVTIDAGKGDGIRVDDPVISGAGLVGRVTAVTGGAAQVTLLTDPGSGSAVSGRVVPSGAQGIVRAEVGDPDLLVLDFIDTTRRIGKGNTVVTAGWKAGDLASLYPPNIPIGEVTEASLTEQEASQTVRLRPFADMRDLDLLEVLTGGWRG
jgi:rod shape-determining protein MreC